jgi:hypothetical protein
LSDNTRGRRPFDRRALYMMFPLALILVVIALPENAFSQPGRTPADDTWNTLAVHSTAEFAAADLENVGVDDSGLRVGPDETFVDRDAPDSNVFGVLTSPAILSESPFKNVRLTYDADVPEGTGISFEVRVQSANSQWSQWQEVETSGEGFSAAANRTAAQYRATLKSNGSGTSPILRSVELDTQQAGGQMAEFQALVSHPTVRVYGTREGLAGRTTSNGHKIVDKDRFVALPSKKALNPKDGTDYQVQISYKGKTVTAPVWDVGPWNSKDNYWDSPREQFNDIPRFTPQVSAAFFNNYNNGNDGYGRPVIYPAAIDIADGTFIDDLGMKSSDWVDVTFLWVDAAAPPLVPMPVVVPKPGPIPQPIFQQQQQQQQQRQQDLPPVPPTPTPLPKTWFFAEGSTNKPFDTWLLLQNPDPDPANVKITFMLPKGGQQIGNYVLKPTSRTSLFLNNIVPNSDVSTMIESDHYLLAERAMYFNGNGHDTKGAITPDTTWYFAEGSTKAGFDTWILMQNPNTVPTNVTLTFFKEDGTTVTQKMLIPHVSRESLMVNLVLPDAAFGTRIVADQPIIAERAMYKDKKAGLDAVGATDPSKTWYMAEGNTKDGYDTWLLMMNPNDAAATATVTYMKEEGAPVTKSYTVPAHSRSSVYVDPEAPNTRLGIKVDSSLPIVAERTLYFASGQALHGTMASPILSKLWYLPEGSTAKPFSENVLVMNPGTVPANITATFMKEDGTSVEKKYAVNPTSRITMEVNSIVPDSALSTKVASDQPIVVERSMYFNDFKSGHNSMGIPK